MHKLQFAVNLFSVSYNVYSHFAVIILSFTNTNTMINSKQGQVESAEKHFRKDMDKSFFGRCHPDNIWALSGLEQCLLRRPCVPQQEHSVTLRAAELVEVQRKLALLKIGGSESNIKVACMCATKKY